MRWGLCREQPGVLFVFCPNIIDYSCIDSKNISSYTSILWRNINSTSASILIWGIYNILVKLTWSERVWSRIQYSFFATISYIMKKIHSESGALGVSAFGSKRLLYLHFVVIELLLHKSLKNVPIVEFLFSLDSYVRLKTDSEWLEEYFWF